jgi:hypothetical protein
VGNVVVTSPTDGTAVQVTVIFSKAYLLKSIGFTGVPSPRVFSFDTLPLFI